MLWIQLGASFVAWIAFAVSLWMGYYRKPRGRAPRPWRIARGVVVLGASAVVLFLGLMSLQRMQGIAQGELTALGWISATLLGAIFVAMQIDAADALISVVFENETSASAPASDAPEGKKEP